MRNRLFLATCGLSLLINSKVCCAEPRTFTTWVPWQADSVVAGWVLKRYIHPEAVFESVPRGTTLPPERALDTSASPYRRNGRHTAFDEVVRLHKISIPCANRLATIIRVLELAPWRKSENPEAEKFEIELNKLLPKDPAQGGLDAAFAYVDLFCGVPAKKGKR